MKLQCNLTSCGNDYCSQAFGDDHLAAANASVLFDLGMGAGKVAVQAFVQFRNLKYVYGVELSLGRYKYVKYQSILSIGGGII